MPRYREHQRHGRIVGSLVGATGNIFSQSLRLDRQPGTPFDLGEVVACGLVGALVGEKGATAPDWIEPGTSSWHRSTAHSWTALGAVAWVTVQVVQSGTPGAVKLCAGVWGATYVVHLLADAETPRGLPIV